MATSSHAKLSPSSAKSRYTSFGGCPGWVNIPGDSAASLQGTKLHLVMECDGDEGMARRRWPEEVAKRGDATPEWVPLTLEEREYVDSCLEYLKSFPSIAQVHKEVTLPLKKLGLEGTDRGTIDRLWWPKAGELHFLDWKFGKEEVADIVDNPQFLIYMLGVFLFYGNTDSITVHMVQPKLNLIDVETFHRDSQQLKDIEARIRADHEKVLEFNESHNPDLLNPSHLNCERCLVQAKCPKWQTATPEVIKAAALVPIEEAKKPLDLKMIPTWVNTSWDVMKADPVKVALLMEVMPAFEEFIKKFKKFALEVNDLVAPLEGFSVVSSNGTSELVSPNHIIEVAEKYGCTREEVIAAFKPQLGALQELISSKYPTGEKGLRLEEFENELAGAGLLIGGHGFRYLKRKPKSKK